MQVQHVGSFGARAGGEVALRAPGPRSARAAAAAFCAAGSAPISSELRRNGTTSTPAARSWAISASTMMFSPDGWAEEYRLCAMTTFMTRPTLRQTETAAHTADGRMPELPEVEALAAYLRERAAGHVIERVDVAAISALKTFDPPMSAAHGLPVTGAARHGKFLDISVGDDLHLVVHLARAGWLHYRDALIAGAAAPGQGADRACGCGSTTAPAST